MVLTVKLPRQQWQVFVNGKQRHGVYKLGHGKQDFLNFDFRNANVLNEGA